jgi:large subunit ribosomal protein L6
VSQLRISRQVAELLNRSVLAMLSTTRARGLEKVLSSSNSVSIPSFLLPAFQTTSHRSFSSSSPTQSQIGKAPLSIPPEVNFAVILPQTPKNGRHSPASARPTVSIEGPRGKFQVDISIIAILTLPSAGKLTMTIPPFVHLEHDQAARKAVVSVENREERKQREMWGMYPRRSYM